MKERGIIMSADSVRAVLDGRKTVTRRVVEPQPPIGYEFKEQIGEWFRWENPDDKHGKPLGMHTVKAKYMPGDRLYVKEGWRIQFEGGFYDENSAEAYYSVQYRAGGEARQLEFHGRREDEDSYIKAYDASSENFNSPLFMSKWAARIWVEVATIRPGRLHDITDDDVLKEGIVLNDDQISEVSATAESCGLSPLRYVYACEWDKLNRKRGFPWANNDYVFRTEFLPL